jgi:hypothetical protein
MLGYEGMQNWEEAFRVAQRLTDKLTFLLEVCLGMQTKPQRQRFFLFNMLLSSRKGVFFPSQTRLCR